MAVHAVPDGDRLARGAPVGVVVCVERSIDSVCDALDRGLGGGLSVDHRLVVLAPLHRPSRQLAHLGVDLIDLVDPPTHFDLRVLRLNTGPHPVTELFVMVDPGEASARQAHQLLEMLAARIEAAEPIS